MRTTRSTPDIAPLLAALRADEGEATHAAPEALWVPVPSARRATAAADPSPTQPRGAVLRALPWTGVSICLGTMACIAWRELAAASAADRVRPCPPEIYARATTTLIEGCFASVRGSSALVQDCSVAPEQHCIPNDVWACVVGAVCNLGPQVRRLLRS